MGNNNLGTASIANAMLLADRERRLLSANQPTPAAGMFRDRGLLAAGAVLAGISLMSAVTFAAGLSAVSAGQPEAWSHGLIMLGVGQLAVVFGGGLKFYSIMESYKFRVTQQSRVAAFGMTDRSRKALVTGPRLATHFEAQDELPRGRLGNREYLEFPDGSIEIDTLLGRRRFISLDAAREFVGE